PAADHTPSHKTGQCQAQDDRNRRRGNSLRRARRTVIGCGRGHGRRRSALAKNGFGGKEVGHGLLLVDPEIARVRAHEALIEDAARELVEVFGLQGGEGARADLGGLGDFFQRDAAHLALAPQPFAKASHSRCCSSPARISAPYAVTRLARSRAFGPSRGNWKIAGLKTRHHRFGAARVSKEFPRVTFVFPANCVREKPYVIMAANLAGKRASTRRIFSI